MPKHMPKGGVADDGSKTAEQSSAKDTCAADALAVRGRPGGELGAPRSVRDVGMSSASFPLLTRTNYPSWSVLMKVIMEARHVWKAVETGDVEYEEDRLAMEAILRSVPTEMVLTPWRQEDGQGSMGHHQDSAHWCGARTGVEGPDLAPPVRGDPVQGR
uniref:DUF4219 domain-containing protein n=1 Tax=Aegilops tauschii subsp. strangulata TaxID=200361 RepID=A0A453D7N0_AEGTS